MDVSKLKRDATKVHSILKETNTSLVAVKACKVYIPTGYFGASLGTNDDKLLVLGIFPIVLDDTYYAVSKACALYAPEPSSSQLISIDGEEYMELSFEPGDNLIADLNLIQTSTITFRIYDYFETKGKVPWFINADDLATIFDTAEIHAGVNLGVDQSVLEMFSTVVTRDPKDKRKYFRHVTGAARNKRPQFTPLRSVGYSATNTSSKLHGNYFNEGVTSALIDPSTQSQSIESQLRSTKE